ncbi:MAG: hypothetical protein AAGI53_07270 [Planctomycetota bacterium]
MKTAAIIALVAAGSVASAQNLLSNSSFESALNYDGAPAPVDVGNWFAFFGGADFQQAEIVDPTGGLAPQAAPDGASVLQIITAGTANTFVGVVQNVAATAGLEYTFSFLARNIDPQGANTEFRIEWERADGSIIGDQFALNTNITDSLTTDFQEFSLSAIAPTDATALNVVIAAQTFGTPGTTAAFQYDSASLTAIPTPAGAAVLGFAGLAAARRRR